MVIIQNISSVRSMVCIYLDTEEKYWIRSADFSASGFHEGDEYSREDFLRKIRIIQYPRALNYAVSMLAKRPCSKEEIRTRLLHKYYAEDVSDLVIYKLEKENLLNDEDFSEQWMRYRISRKCGPALIRRELKMKGIEESLIDKQLDALDSDEKYRNAVQLAGKAWNRMKPGDDIRKSRQKVIATLVRKGYDWETARAACEQAKHDDT